MAGRRLRDTVAAKLAPVVKHVVIAAYSNDYAGYITTKQEYDTQQYEGGHTLYGPWTLTGYQQEFARLAQALAAGSTIAADTTPRDLRGQVESTPLGTPYDATPENAAIGDLVEDAHEKYTKGDQVTVTFWSTHLQNGFSTDRRYLDVQLKTGNAWTTVAADEDWSTKLIWKPIDSDAHTAQATITWDIPNDAQPGTYRIRHHLVAKSQSDGKINASIATSREFNIE
jgi:neutral ceramidase